MTIATPAHAQVKSSAIQGPKHAECLHGLPHCESEISRRTGLVARTEALVSRAETVLVEMTPRWRPSEDEIERAAITVILVALVAIIALAAAGALTMG